MKKLFVLVIFFAVIQSAFAQKLEYKIRTLGISLYGNYGMSYPASIYGQGSTDHIKPAYPLINEVPTSFEDYKGNDIEASQNTFTLGASLHYKHSFGSRFILTLLGGYAQTQVSHYLINLKPLPSNSHPFDAWHEWYNYRHYFAGLQMGLPLGKKMGRFFNLGCNVSIANIAAPLIQKDVTAYPGIVENGIRAWTDPSINAGFTFIDNLNSDVIILTPSIKYLIQFGKYNSHAFELGLSYSFSLYDNLITTEYLRFQNGTINGESTLNFKGDYIAMEASYSIPIFKSSKKFIPRTVHYTPSPIPSPSTQPDPLIQQIIPDLKSCFNIKSTKDIRYEENHFKFNQNMVEFELYQKDGLNDGDMVTVCVEGKIELKKLQLTDRGTRFKVNTTGKKEVNILVYMESGGNQGNTSLGISLVSGGQVNTIEKDAPAGKYYWFKLERE